MSKNNTNEDLVIHMMNFSRTGMIGQVAIVEAISRYAKECSEITDQDIKDNESSFISFASLRDWGNETIERMNTFYETNKIT